jgi:hypothetical protein
MEDVLASIRRLVAEESDRAPAARAPKPEADPAPEAAPEVAEAPADPVRRVLPRRPTVSDSLLPTRKDVGRAARAKLLLTDDFRVEDLRRWSDAPPTDEGTPDPTPDAPTVPAHGRSPANRSRTLYADETQSRLAEDIDAFLGDDAPAATPEPAPPVADEDADEIAEAAPPLRRRPRRAPQADSPVPEAPPAAETDAAVLAVLKATEEAMTPPRVPEPPVAAAPVRAPEKPQVPLDRIEEAVRASLEALRAEGALDAPPEPSPGELMIDEESLREIVSDIVRKELQGSLGERITRNVRKLVRREIYRALEARDLG